MSLACKVAHDAQLIWLPSNLIFFLLVTIGYDKHMPANVKKKQTM